MSDPLITVFLPTHSRFNNGLLQKSVESVLGQSYAKFEFLIVDDASRHDSADYLRRIADEDRRVKLIRYDQNIGLLAFTLAQAYLKSNGEFLAFAFDNTEWFPNHLEILKGQLEDNPIAGMVYGGVSIEPPGTKPSILGHSAFNLTKLFEQNYLGHSGVMLRRRTIEYSGWLDPHILVKRTCDWDLWMRIGRKLPVVYCPEVVAMEKGLLQADSLGLSVSQYDALTRKYQQTRRDHLLKPEAIVQQKTAIFEPPPWMTDEEKLQLRILNFEHLLRTRQLEPTIELSYQWLSDVGEEVADLPAMEVLTDAFNMYLAETRYACKNTCSSAFKLSDLTDSHNQLENDHFWLKQEKRDLQDQNRRLREVVDHLEHRCEQLQSSNDEVSKHFGLLRSAHDNLQSIQGELRQDRNQAQEQYEKLLNRSSELEKEIAQLLPVKDEFRDLDERYQSLLRSLSWRITKPLRDISKLRKRI